ncbi:MAG: hypothetical protein KC731_14885 [Myxococcales bacterium]|nr:hypothetical protein [Myxococcales bacterium]
MMARLMMGLLVMGAGACAQVLGADFGDYTLSGAGGATGTGGSEGGANVGGAGTGGTSESPMDILVLQSVDELDPTDTPVQGLMATNHFAAVDLFDVAMATPTLTELQAYDAVLVTSRNGIWADAFALGDVLDAYHLAGGKVVVTALGICQTEAIRGDFEQNLVFAPSGGLTAPVPPSVATLDITEDGAMFDGVAALPTSMNYCQISLANGAVAMAGVSGGDSAAPLVARRVVHGRTRVDVNLLFVSDYENNLPSVYALLANALRYPE